MSNLMIYSAYKLYSKVEHWAKNYPKNNSGNIRSQTTVRQVAIQKDELTEKENEEDKTNIKDYNEIYQEENIRVHKVYIIVQAEDHSILILEQV